MNKKQNKVFFIVTIVIVIAILLWVFSDDFVGNEFNECDYSNNKDNCYSETAKARGDNRLCQLIIKQDVKDNCYLQIAEMNKNPGLCDKIVFDTIKRNCLERSKVLE